MADDAGYKELICKMQLEPLTYKEIAGDWEKRPEEWYHAMIAIEDLPIVLAIPSLKIYSWCRCKVVADDGSEGHFHWHGLVHFKDGSKNSWRQKALRCGIKFTSRKNTFKKVKCLDHAVGVLRYIACADGQRSGRRDGDGLVTHPHTHYARQTINQSHLHVRGKRCVEIRSEISNRIASFMDLNKKSNWSADALHDCEKCLCDRGKIGKERREAANEKRRNFYKTEAGMAIKKKYREKAAFKRQLLNHLSMLQVSKKATLCHETIEKLVKLL